MKLSTGVDLPLARVHSCLSMLGAQRIGGVNGIFATSRCMCHCVRQDLISVQFYCKVTTAYLVTELSIIGTNLMVRSFPSSLLIMFLPYQQFCWRGSTYKTLIKSPLKMAYSRHRRQRDLELIFNNGRSSVSPPPPGRSRPCRAQAHTRSSPRVQDLALTHTHLVANEAAIVLTAPCCLLWQGTSSGDASNGSIIDRVTCILRSDGSNWN